MGMSNAVSLNNDNFDAEVFASGKNAFIKFQAPWWGHCKKMKPAWDQLSREYDTSDSVIIGDVDCTVEKELCQKWKVEGYPTVGYFTQETGQKKLDYSGGRDFDSIKRFTESTLQVELCRLDGSNCNEREVKYIAKYASKSADEASQEMSRLKKMVGSNMAPSLSQWLSKRINILTQYTKAKEEL